MYVDVYIEDPLLISQELENGQNYVVDIAKARCFGLLSVMKTSRPIDGNIGRSLIQLDCARNGTA